MAFTKGEGAFECFAEAGAITSGEFDAILDDEDLAFNIGRVFYRIDREERAVDYYRLSLQVDGEHRAVYFNLGLCLERSGRRSEGIEALERALELDPEYTKAETRLKAMRAREASGV